MYAVRNDLGNIAGLDAYLRLEASKCFSKRFVVLESLRNSELNCCIQGAVPPIVSIVRLDLFRVRILGQSGNSNAAQLEEITLM